MRRIFEGKENEYYEKIDAKGNKSVIRMKKLSPEIVKEDTDLLLTRFHNTNVDTTIIMNENIKVGDCFDVDCATLYSDRGYKFDWDIIAQKRSVKLKLLDDKTGKCQTMVYLLKMKDIEAIEDKDIRQCELLKVSIDRRSIIKYKEDDKEIEGIVLGCGIRKYIIIDLADFNSLIQNKKNAHDIKIKAIDRNKYIEVCGILDEENEKKKKKYEKNKLKSFFDVRN